MFVIQQNNRKLSKKIICLPETDRQNGGKKPTQQVEHCHEQYSHQISTIYNLWKERDLEKKNNLQVSFLESIFWQPTQDNIYKRGQRGVDMCMCANLVGKYHDKSMKVLSPETVLWRICTWWDLTAPEHLCCTLIGLINPGFVGNSLEGRERKTNRMKGRTFHHGPCSNGTRVVPWGFQEQGPLLDSCSYPDSAGGATTFTTIKGSWSTGISVCLADV